MRLAVGSRIKSRRMAATSTNGSVVVPAKFWALTKMAADTLRWLYPTP